jgi:hypothetical protein
LPALAVGAVTFVLRATQPPAMTAMPQSSAARRVEA